MPDRHAYRGALEAVDRILNRGGTDEEVLEAVVEVVRERTGLAIVSIRPGALEAQPVPDDEGRAFLDRVALLVSAHAARVPPSE
jgi:uncharacterized protein (DUF362 family)